MKFTILFFYLTGFFTHAVDDTTTLGLCRSKLYCIGGFLHTVQMSGIFNDSKTFVDMPSRSNELDVLQKFSKMESKNLTNIKNFVEENFYPNGYEVIKVKPIDWKPHPDYILKINDYQLKNFAVQLNLKWNSLNKKFDLSQICSDCESSTIVTNNSFIVPGGRFNEYYYWDTYWVVEGLLISGMHETVKGILENFLDILEQNGFVPNGARIYYLNRSQPPLLTQMVYTYFNYTNDTQFLKTSIDLLDKEHEFWMSLKSIEIEKDGQKYILNRYKVDSHRPRPESYREDFTNGQESGNSSKYFSNVMTAAESGWDFSSRWFKDPMDIKTIQIDKILPVDLNSIMYRNEVILSEFHDLLNNQEKSKNYKNMSEQRHKAINSVFWDHKVQSYGDYNFEENKVHAENLYITDLSPLWFGIQPTVDEDIILKRYESLLYDHVSGIPASDINTHQQWDFPNVWAPYHDWMVSYLVRSNQKDKGKDIAKRFVNTVYCGWKKSNNIYEKYNASRQGEYGQGGEYVVQEGFGWTNGVAIKFLNEFSQDLEADCEQNFENSAVLLKSHNLQILFFIIFYLFNFRAI